MASNQEAKLKVLQQAFVKADKDGNSLLNKEEFKEFVEIGYKKPCPPQMYASLCSHFGRDPDIGIDWTTARKVWEQAQAGANKSKTPQPPKPTQNGKSQPQIPIQNTQTIKQAFIQCDADGDGLLKKSEFHNFVKTGFKKPSVPNGMYEQVCGHFQKDPAVGIDWLSAFSLWKKSNPQSDKPANKPTNIASPNTSQSPQKRPPNIRRIKTSRSPRGMGNKTNKFPAIGTLSPTKSTGQLYPKHRTQNSYSGSGSALTERNLRQLEKNTHRIRGDDEQSNDSEHSYRSSQNTSSRRHRRLESHSKGGRVGSSFDDGVDATQMVVQMMETKVKNLQNQLKLERTKRKKTEELAQSLLTQNEEFKKQISDMNSQSTKHKSENKTFKDQLRKLKQIVDDDRNTIKHLKEQRNAKKNERDEAYTLLTKIEKEHANLVKKEKQKHAITIAKEKESHKNAMEQLSAGFLQSLGAEPGKDVATVIKELKQNNADLDRRVDELAATLARKSESLVHALQAVDNLAMNEEKTFMATQALVNEVQPSANTTANGGSKSKMKNKLKSFHQRRKSKNLGKISAVEMTDDNMSGLPKPPRRRNSQVGIGKPRHRPTATFFKRAVGDKNAGKTKLDLSNAKNGKELQFVTTQLTSDVATKTQSIQNLEMANTALMQQMQKMQKQMSNLKSQNGNNHNSAALNGNHQNQESNVSISDLP